MSNSLVVVTDQPTNRPTDQQQRKILFKKQLLLWKKMSYGWSFFSRKFLNIRPTESSEGRLWRKTKLALDLSSSHHFGHNDDLMMYFLDLTTEGHQRTSICLFLSGASRYYLFFFKKKPKFHFFHFIFFIKKNKFTRPNNFLFVFEFSWMNEKRIFEETKKRLFQTKIK